MFRDRSLALGVLALLLAGACCHAQDNTHAVVFTSNGKHVTIPEGMMLSLRTVPAETKDGAVAVPPDRFLETTLDKKIDGKRSRPGDPVRLTLTYALSFELDGSPVRIPERASILGHIVLVSPRDAQHSPARLALVTDSVQWPGHQMLLPAVVASAAKPRRAGGALHTDYHDSGPIQPANAAGVVAAARGNKGSY